MHLGCTVCLPFGAISILTPCLSECKETSGLKRFHIYRESKGYKRWIYSGHYSRIFPRSKFLEELSSKRHENIGFPSPRLHAQSYLQMEPSKSAEKRQTRKAFLSIATPAKYQHESKVVHTCVFSGLSF